MRSRGLTEGEAELARSVFADAVDYRRVRIHRRKWFPLQPKNALMAPTGHIHAHPHGDLWSEDYSRERLGIQGLFLHEMTHVWQAQQRGRFYLPLMRHPFCRYRYRFEANKSFRDYGVEQQAEIVRHVFLLRRGQAPRGAPPLDALEALLPFDS